MTSLRAHQHRMRLSDTNVCDCEQGIEDVHHFLFECTRYRAARNTLLQTITSICEDAECNRRLLMTVSSLLNPEDLQVFSVVTVTKIGTETAVFVQYGTEPNRNQGFRQPNGRFGFKSSVLLYA